MENEQTWHGFVAQQSGPGARKSLVVGSVDEASPAAESGLRPGDIIKTVNNTQVMRALDLERALLGHKAGEKLELTVQRDRRPRKLSLVLASAAARRPPANDLAWEVLGLQLSSVGEEELGRQKSRYRGGLLVTAVRPDSPAAEQGVRRGDILVGMHLWETVSLSNVTYILNLPDLAHQEPVKFYILRGDKPLFGYLRIASRE
jgi:serine protease Do